MKIVRLTAENVKRLKLVEIAPDGSIVQITGKNGAGKSSVLDSILYALAGGKALPKQPIRRGEKEAKVRVDLGELIVTRKFGEGGATSLVVEGKTGARYSSPQRMLDELLGAICFDPLAFSRMEPKAQFDMLRSISKLEVDLEALAGKNKSDFEARTEVNRKAKAARAAAEAIQVPAELPDQPIDAKALLDEIQAAHDHNAKAQRQRVAREAVTTDVTRLRERQQQLESELTRVRNHADELEQGLKDAPPLPEPIDVMPIRQKLDDAEKIKVAIVQRDRKAELVAEVAKAEAEAKRLTDAIEARDKAKTDALAAAKMPIDNIGLGEGVVLLNGLPFDQASSAEQLRTSVAIAMAANPKLKVMLIREGGLLDEDGMKILGEMTAAADYQCWVETVHANGPVAVEMVDGAAKGADDETKATPATQPKEARADGSLL